MSKNSNEEKKSNESEGVSKITLEVRGFDHMSRVLRALVGLGVLLALSSKYGLELEPLLRMLGAFGAGAFTLYTPPVKGTVDVE